MAYFMPSHPDGAVHPLQTKDPTSGLTDQDYKHLNVCSREQSSHEGNHAADTDVVLVNQLGI